MKSLVPYRIWLAEDAYSAGHAGFWGDRGAGVLPLCKSTGRFLLSRRSEGVNEPGTWSTWGGKMERGETPKDTAKRELCEESGYVGSIDMVSLSPYRDGKFEFHNFLGITEREFEPRVKVDEVSEFAWLRVEEMGKLEDRHFGLDHILNRDAKTLLRWALIFKQK